MTVQSYVMIRAIGEGTNESPFGPKTFDLDPYAILSWSDYSARASGISDGPLFLSMQMAEPRVMILDVRMTNAAALSMSTDNKLWMIESTQYDSEGEVVLQNRDEIYTVEERTTRINQLGNFTDFDVDTISAWWTLDKTRREVAVKLRNYLRTLNAVA